MQTSVMQLMGIWEFGPSCHFSRSDLPMTMMGPQALSLARQGQNSQLQRLCSAGQWGKRGALGTCGSVPGSLTCPPQVQQAENLRQETLLPFEKVK